MFSFYGGKQGESFNIKEVFPNRVALEVDVTQNNSNILIDDFVFINYGQDNVEGSPYNKNVAIDTDRFKTTQNLTLWKKIYYSLEDKKSKKYIGQIIAPSNTEEGIKYLLIAALPQIKFPNVTAGTATILPPTREPNINIEGPDSAPKINISWPGPWNITAAIGESKTANLKPDVNITEIGNPVDTKQFTFNLPKPWDLEINNSEETLNPGDTPQVNFQDTEKKLSQGIKTIHFILPTTEKLQSSIEVNSKDPDYAPTASLNKNNKKEPKLILNLPKAAKFYSGTIDPLGNGENVSISGIDISSGDYYINRNTGNIYLVNNINKNNRTATFTYYGCIKGPKGDVGDPFSIKTIYKSILEMNQDFNNPKIPIGSFVIINTDNVQDPDDAKLFYKTNTEYKFLTDLSGAQGIRGPQGEVGPAAGFDTPVASAHKIDPNSIPTVNIATSGSNTNKKFIFDFGVPQGIQGIQGEKGDNWKPSINSKGIISWTLNKNNTPPDPVSIKGDKGDTGNAAGFDIPAAFAKKLSPDSIPTVDINASGDNTNKKFTFNFGIPQGVQGEKGDKGDNWKPNITDDGIISWTLNNTGTSPVQKNIKGPKGDPIEIIDFLDYSKENNLSEQEIENRLNAKLPLKNNSLIGVSISENYEIKTYHYVYINGGWKRLLVSGKASVPWEEF